MSMKTETVWAQLSGDGFTVFRSYDTLRQAHSAAKAWVERTRLTADSGPDHMPGDYSKRRAWYWNGTRAAYENY